MPKKIIAFETASGILFQNEKDAICYEVQQALDKFSIGHEASKVIIRNAPHIITLLSQLCWQGKTDGKWHLRTFSDEPRIGESE